jgi:hypothetical protein
LTRFVKREWDASRACRRAASLCRAVTALRVFSQRYTPVADDGGSSGGR